MFKNLLLVCTCNPRMIFLTLETVGEYLLKNDNKDSGTMCMGAFLISLLILNKFHPLKNGRIQVHSNINNCIPIQRMYLKLIISRNRETRIMSMISQPYGRLLVQ